MKKNALRQRLRTPAEIQSLSIRSHFPIGSGKDGHIFTGRLKFNQGKRIRVAVKRFHAPINDAQAARYQKIIQRLYDAGVSIPKMGMAKTTNGEWVLVSQLFGSTEKGSQLEGVFFKHPRAKRDAIIQAVRITNAGFSPAEDIIEPFKEQRKGALPIDLHSLFERPLREDIQYRVGQLMEYLAFVEPNPKRRSACIQLAIAHANPTVQRAIRHYQSTQKARP